MILTLVALPRETSGGESDYGIANVLQIMPHTSYRAVMATVATGPQLLTINVGSCGHEYSRATYPSSDMVVRATKMAKGCSSTRSETEKNACWAPSDPSFMCSTRDASRAWCAGKEYFGYGPCCCIDFDCGWADFWAISEGREKCGWYDRTKHYVAMIDCCQLSEVTTGYPVVSPKTFCDISTSLGNSTTNFTLYDDTLSRLFSLDWSVLAHPPPLRVGTLLSSACSRSNIIWPAIPNDEVGNPGISQATCDAYPHSFDICAQSALMPVMTVHGVRHTLEATGLFAIHVLSPGGALKVEFAEPFAAGLNHASCICSADNDFLCPYACRGQWATVAEAPNALIRCTENMLHIPSGLVAITAIMNRTCQLAMRPSLGNYTNPLVFDIGTLNSSTGGNWAPGCAVGGPIECISSWAAAATSGSWWIVIVVVASVVLVAAVIVIWCCCRRSQAGSSVGGGASINFSPSFAMPGQSTVPSAVSTVLACLVIASVVQLGSAEMIVPFSDTVSVWIVQPTADGITDCVITDLYTGFSLSVTPSGMDYMEIPLPLAAINLTVGCWRGSKFVSHKAASPQLGFILSSCHILSPIPCMLAGQNTIWQQIATKVQLSRWSDLLCAIGIIILIVIVLLYLGAAIFCKCTIWPWCVPYAKGSKVRPS